MAQIVITAGRFSSLSASNRFRHRPRKGYGVLLSESRYRAANDIFDAGLRRSRHRNRIPVAAQSRGDPKDIDFGTEPPSLPSWPKVIHPPANSGEILAFPRMAPYDCSGISIVERPGAFKQLSNALVLALHHSTYLVVT
jgi:hypothetical protein